MQVVHRDSTIITGDGLYSPGLNKADSQTLIRTLPSLAFRLRVECPLPAQVSTPWGAGQPSG